MFEKLSVALVYPPKILEPNTFKKTKIVSNRYEIWFDSVAEMFEKLWVALA